jgi:hypothetical protein
LPQTGTLPQTRRPARRRQKSQFDWGLILKIGLIAGGVLFGIVLLAVAGVVGWKFLGPASPEAVFAKATSALEQEDWKGFFDCMTPEGQDQVAAAMLGMAAMAARGGSRVPADKQEKVQQLKAVLEDHGIDQETLEGMPAGFELLSTARNPEKMKPYLAPIRNRSAFIADMIDVLQEIGDREMPTPPLIDAHLEDVKIDGDTATAVAVGTKDGQERRDKIHFRKVGGSWKIAPDSLGRL